MRIRGRYFIFILVLFLVSCFSGTDKEIEVKSFLDKNTVTIGDRFIYTLRVVVDKDVEVKMPKLTENLGGFTLEGFSRRRRVFLKKIVYEQNYKLSTYRTGDFTLSPLKILYKRKSERGYKKIKSPPLKIRVESLLAKEGSSQLKDIYPVIDPPRRWGIIFLFFLITLGSFSLLYYFLRKKRGQIRSNSSLPAHKKALAEIELLEGKGYLEDKDYRSFYFELSRILRNYIENRFGLKAAHMSTEEFLLYLKDNNYFLAEQKQLLENFLSFSDLVKFAKFVPLEEEARKNLFLVKEFIEQTKEEET